LENEMQEKKCSRRLVKSSVEIGVYPITIRVLLLWNCSRNKMRKSYV
jgi:hypothetical protein